MNRPLASHRAAALSILLALPLVAGLAGCGKKTTKTSEIQYATVERKTIEVTVEATGTVEPIDLIEVKSKASGQIVKMNVAVGSVVKPGELLAQIDTRDVDNRYTQALAAYRASQASASVGTAQKKRADALFAQGIITAPEHETAILSAANSTSQLIKARTDLDIARQQKEDATVRAPGSGTVLSQAVAVGQVISSATSSVSGGTTLLTIADLSRIRMRALVSESDIGNVAAGMPATVTVDAFPNRTFRGTVEKIEPQAVVQQSVTMFPVLVSLDNEDGVLLPGMNGEVSIRVASRPNALAISLDAVRTVREVPTVATALGLKPDEVQKQVEAQVAARQAARRDSTQARGGRSASGDTAANAGFRGRMANMTEAQRDSMRARYRAGGGGGGRGGRGGSDASAGTAAGMGSGGGAMAAGGGGRANRAQVAFVKTATGLEPRILRLGLSNYDDAEVLDGLKEGDQVALLSVAELQAKRTQDQATLRSRMSGGTPGMPGGAAGGRGTGGGGGGGRTRGGGGGR
jgi:HlyD family secretion protein